MDNLNADWKTVPAIIVMPFRHKVSGATWKVPEVRAVQEMLGVKGVNHEYTESPGYRHDYQIWRIYLHTVQPKLFRQ